MVNLSQHYDPLNGHRMLLIELRPDGNELYADIDAEYERTICSPGTMLRHYPGIGMIVPNKEPKLIEDNSPVTVIDDSFLMAGGALPMFKIEKVLSV